MTGQEKCDLLLQVTAWAGLIVHNQASTLTYYSTCPFGQLTQKSTFPTQSFSYPKKLIKITKTRK